MPFLNQIIEFINDTLKAGSLNKDIFQPQQLYGLATAVVRNKTPASKVIETLPGIIKVDGTDIPITPDNKMAIQIYHRLESSLYTIEKKGYGNVNYQTDVSSLYLAVLTNSKLTGRTKESLEPVVRFGMPDSLSDSLNTQLRLRSCRITPTSSNMKHLEIFRQEYPQNDYFLNEINSIFLIKYSIRTTYDPTCLDLENIN